VITKDACKRLDLQVGRSATAIIKASSVMIGVE
jgi:molybdopterin-binding protein